MRWALLPLAPLIILDLLEMLMSCWVIAHVRPGSRDDRLSWPRSLKWGNYRVSVLLLFVLLEQAQKLPPKCFQLSREAEKIAARIRAHTCPQ